MRRLAVGGGLEGGDAGAVEAGQLDRAGRAVEVGARFLVEVVEPVKRPVLAELETVGA